MSFYLIEKFDQNRFSRLMDRCVLSRVWSAAWPWPPSASYNAWHIRAGNVGHAIRYVSIRGSQENRCDTIHARSALPPSDAGEHGTKSGIYAHPGARSMAAANCTSSLHSSALTSFSTTIFVTGVRKRYQTRTFYGVLDRRKLVQVGLKLCRELRGAMGRSIRSQTVRNFLPALVPDDAYAWARTFCSARNANLLNRIVTSATTSRCETFL